MLAVAIFVILTLLCWHFCCQVSFWNPPLSSTRGWLTLHQYACSSHKPPALQPAPLGACLTHSNLKPTSWRKPDQSAGPHTNGPAMIQPWHNRSVRTTPVEDTFGASNAGGQKEKVAGSYRTYPAWGHSPRLKEVLPNLIIGINNTEEQIKSKASRVKEIIKIGDRWIENSIYSTEEIANSKSVWKDKKIGKSVGLTKKKEMILRTSRVDKRIIWTTLCP